MNPLILLFTLLNATLLYAAGGVPAYPSTGYFVMYLNVTLGPSAAFQGPFGTRDSTPFTAYVPAIVSIVSSDIEVEQVANSWILRATALAPS